MIDDEILVQKVKEPSKVKYILALKNNVTEEENLIEDFLMVPHANPNRYTVAMEGRPFSMLVVMKNGLRYRASMTRLVYLDWKVGLNPQQQLEQNPGQGNLAVRSHILSQNPIVDLNSFTYALLLRPLHQMAKTERNDVLDVRWSPEVNILTAKPCDIKGTAIGMHSFAELNTLAGFFVHYPPYMRKLFKAIQSEYEKYRGLGILGQAIYTIPDPTKPPRGTMHPLGRIGEEYGVMDIRYINPNQRIKTLAHHNISSPPSLPRQKEI